MMKKFIWGLLAVLCMACYDDLGNYDYTDINDMMLEMPKSLSVIIPKKDSVLVTVRASVSQLDRKDNGNLSYLWKKNTKGVTWTECGTDSICSLWVYPKDKGRITLRLAVTDKDQNIVTFGETIVNLVAAFNRCWFVLQDINGQSVLGAIDGEGESRVVNQDIYKKETGGVLVGKPLFLSVNNMHTTNMYDNTIATKETLVGVFTEGGTNYMLDGATLENRYTYDRMLYYKRIVTDDSLGIGLTNSNPIYAEGDSKGECIIDNGVFWYARPDGYSVYYPVKSANGAWGSSPYEDYYAEMASMAYVSGGGLNIIFDSKNNRFLSHVNIENGGNEASWNMFIHEGMSEYYEVSGVLNKNRLEPIQEQAGYPNKFNPNDIGDKDVIYMGATTSRDEPKILAVATFGSGLYAYEFSPEMMMGEKGANCSGYWELTPEAGNMEEKLPVATSAYFDRMFFYAVGNKIYRADLTRSTPRSYLIYEHPESSVRITKLKFRSQREDRWDISGGDNVEGIPCDLVSYLGAVVEYSSGEGSVVEMKLSQAGEIKKDEAKLPMAYEYKGFGKIVDFIYAFR